MKFWVQGCPDVHVPLFVVPINYTVSCLGGIPLWPLETWSRESQTLEWAIKELHSLPFLCRHFAIELCEATGEVMLCECDRKQIRWALTALILHCWTANVRRQTSYVQTIVCVRKRESGLGFIGLRAYLWFCVCHLSMFICMNAQCNMCQDIQGFGGCWDKFTLVHSTFTLYCAL